MSRENIRGVGDRLASLSSRVRKALPIDLVAIVVLVSVVHLTFVLPPTTNRPAQLLVGLAFVLFAPGYVVLAVLYPRHDRVVSDPLGVDGASEGTTARIDVIERLSLSFPVSVALIAPLTLLFGAREVPLSYAGSTVVAVYSGILLVGAVVGVIQRHRVPESERFRLPVGRWTSAAARRLGSDRGYLARWVDVQLLLVVLLAIGALGYVVAVPNGGPSYSEFYLVTENASGEYVASDYPTELVAGEPASLTVAVRNDGPTATDYTVVAQQTRVRAGNGSVTVVDRAELERFELTVPPNATRYHSHTITPTLRGENLRLEYTLHRGDPPRRVTGGDAYRHLYIWVNASAHGSEARG